MPSAPSTRPSAGGRLSAGNGAAQLPSGNRPSAGTGNRASQLPAKGNAGLGARPGKLPAGSGAGNFLGVAAGVGSGAVIGNAIGNGPSQLPAADRGGRADRAARPEQRPNWDQRSQNRDNQWRQRVDDRSDAWNKRGEQRQQRRDEFQKNREARWDKIQSGREDRQNSRDQRREDRQQRRQERWDYRADRAEEIWDNVQDIYDDVFDDVWWGGCWWGTGWGYYPTDPWWWWGSATWSSVGNYMSISEEPVYADYDMNVVYEDETAFVDDKPIPKEEYEKPIVEAASIDRPAPPLPSSDSSKSGEWMPLGVFALAQEEKGDPVMFFQLSINRDGIISGAFQNTITTESRPVSGKADKKTQRAGWRIGENQATIFETTLGNLTQDVSPIAIHFQNGQTQTWLMVRMPQPAPAGQEQKLPQAPKSPPPLKTAQVKGG
jgi:hypothetical protein